MEANTEDDRNSSSDSERNEDEAREEDVGQERSGRFVETRDNPEVLKIKSLNQGDRQLAPFYNGNTLDQRMAEVRKSIYYIRHHWEERGHFLKDLKNLLEKEVGLDFTDETTAQHCSALLTKDRTWLTTEAIKDKNLEFEAVKLYTSKDGHSKIYRLANYIFRTKDDVPTSVIRTIVFLVELINIDLYNYCLSTPSKADFQGIVYRGMGVTEDDLGAFRDLRNQPLSSRNIAVPLGLFASSSDVKVAKKFMRNQLRNSDLHPLLLKIHVISLRPEFVETYKRFPNAELTTICSVDIHDISRYPREKEVILRGPFMVVMDMYTDELIKIYDKPCTVVESVMLNANRDHISTSHLGEEDALARDMFAAMVAVTRNEFVMKFYRSRGLTEEEQEYSRLLQESTARLSALVEK